MPNEVIPTTDERMMRNDNGTWWCQQCHLIVIIFADDEQTHDCIGHDWKDDYD